MKRKPTVKKCEASYQELAIAYSTAKRVERNHLAQIHDLQTTNMDLERQLLEKAKPHQCPVPDHTQCDRLRWLYVGVYFLILFIFVGIVHYSTRLKNPVVIEIREIVKPDEKLADCQADWRSDQTEKEILRLKVKTLQSRLRNFQG